MNDDKLHIVDFTESQFAIQHPLSERVTLPSLLDCPMHAYLSSLPHCPVDKPGRYVLDDDGSLTPYQKIESDT